ncbi:MAG: pyridoxal-phosphate-dependent aminotransferase family protein [bacterium]
MIKPKYKLYTPGPVAVPPEYLRAQSNDLLYHREAGFARLMDSVAKGLAKVFLTNQPVYVLTASGTGAMEAAVANLVNPQDRVIVTHCGKFGERWRELVIRFGGYVDELSRPYGESIPPEELERKLKTNDAARCVFTTLTETSTGALNDIKSFGEICHRLNRILVVDAVAGLGIDELQMDAWHLDVVLAGSQKGLAVPPGLSFIALSTRAWEQVEKCKNTRYYFDLRKYRQFAENGQTPWTPAISIYYALDLALKKFNRQGVKKNWQEKATLARHVREKVTKMGLAVFPQHPANALTAIRLPQGVDGTKIVEICKTKNRILLANGQAEMRGKLVRIGHMSPMTKTEADRVLKAFYQAYTIVGGRTVLSRHSY